MANLTQHQMSSQEINDRLRAYYLGMDYDAFINRRHLLRCQYIMLSNNQKLFGMPIKQTKDKPWPIIDYTYRNIDDAGQNSVFLCNNSIYEG